MALRVWQFINIFLSALVAGVYWGRWLGLSRSIASVTPETFLEVGQTMIDNLVPVLPVLTFAAILSTVPVLILLYRRRQSKAFLATGLDPSARLSRLGDLTQKESKTSGFSLTMKRCSSDMNLIAFRGGDGFLYLLP